MVFSLCLWKQTLPTKQRDMSHIGKDNYFKLWPMESIQTSIYRSHIGKDNYLKVGWRGKFFWLIRISMSRNLPESCYNAIDTAEVPLNLCLRWRNWHPLKNVFKRVEPNRPFIWHITQVWWLVNGQALKVDRFLPGFTESVPIFGTPHNHWHIPKVVHKRWEWI